MHQFLLSKMHAFGVEPDQKGNSVAEWRACLFFPTVKIVSFYHFWGLRHQKWTFCCRVACVHHLFLRKMQRFFIIWTLNRDSAAEWSAPFFFASVKLRRFVLISSVLGVKMFIFVKNEHFGGSWGSKCSFVLISLVLGAGNGQKLFPGGSPGAHRRAKVGNDQNRIPGDLLGPIGGQGSEMIKIGFLGTSWGQLAGKIANDQNRTPGDLLGPFGGPGLEMAKIEILGSSWGQLAGSQCIF